MNPSILNTRILLVEDESFMRMLATQALESLGFDSVSEAEDGERALQLLAKQEIDLLVTDIEMKPMSGLDLVKSIRAGESTQQRDTPVIFLSGLGDVSTLAAASELDVHGFLVKPVSAIQLRDKIEEALKSEVRLRDPNTYKAMSFTASALQERDQGDIPGAGYRITTTANHRGGSAETPAQQSRPTAPSPPPAPVGVMVGLNELEPGMVLCHDVLANGVAMLRKGVVLAPGHILVLKNMRSVLADIEFEVMVPEDKVE